MLCDFNKKYFLGLKLTTKYYNEDIHEAAFKLPNFIKNLTK
jgi:spermidine synthase